MLSIIQIINYFRIFVIKYLNIQCFSLSSNILPKANFILNLSFNEQVIGINYMDPCCIINVKSFNFVLLSYMNLYFSLIYLKKS